MKRYPDITAAIKVRILKCLTWYIYPLIYFAITGLVCLYAWNSRPIAHRDGIKAIFKTISVIPALIWTAAITLWAGIIIIVFIASVQLRKRYPDVPLWAWTERFADGCKSLAVPLRGLQTARSFSRKLMNLSLYLSGCILIVAGLMLAVWISRPYLTLLLATSQIEKLEQKVKRGQVLGNRIVIPSVLVDAPILEGVSQGELLRGVCHASNTPAPGEGGNCIIEGHNLAEFGWWKPQSFFSMLEVVEKGTPIYVFYNGEKYTYSVREKTYKNISDPKLYDISPGDRLTLITCVSTWSPTIYTNKRTVIIAYGAG